MIGELYYYPNDEEREPFKLVRFSKYVYEFERNDGSKRRITDNVFYDMKLLNPIQLELF